MLKITLTALLVVLKFLIAQIDQQFKIQNSTEYTFTEIYLFGNRIDSLTPRTVSEWKTYRYNPITDDSMIYCKIGTRRYACYLNIPDKDIDRFSFIIKEIKNEILVVDFAIIRE
jgi:hypothetical protein